MRSAAQPGEVLRLRIASSLVLMVIAVGADLLGVAATGLLAAVLALIMSFEWLRAAKREFWLAMAGLLYIAGAGVAVVALRAEPKGDALLIWLFAIAWAGDTAAFVIGRCFGRHAFWSAISANKTWEGALGGAAIASLVGFVTAPTFDWTFLERLGASAGLALAGQVGDLLESAAKRRLGVKNMSNLVPGHGGVLDRLDSLLLILLIAGTGFALAQHWGVS